jgi:hypothetical protein
MLGIAADDGAAVSQPSFALSFPRRWKIQRRPQQALIESDDAGIICGFTRR